MVGASVGGLVAQCISSISTDCVPFYVATKRVYRAYYSLTVTSGVSWTALYAWCDYCAVATEWGKVWGIEWAVLVDVLEMLGRWVELGCIRKLPLLMAMMEWIVRG